MKYPRGSESGFTMITTVLAMSLVMTLAAVAVTAVRSDTNLTRYDLKRKQAYEAAKAGVEDYAFHLTANNKYWESCTNVPTPNAVNLQGSTAKTRPVPGNTGATYAIELLPAASQTTYTQCSTSNPAASMLELSGGSGSFRIRSTGFAGKSKASIVASFKRPSFLDYVYFTQYETSDPVTYAGGTTWEDDAYTQCEKTMGQGRYKSSIPNSGGQYCNVISFIANEKIRGPLHTNDSIFICGNPTFGRTSADLIELGGIAPGWYWGASSALGNGALDSDDCSAANPTFVGSRKPEQIPLDPPSTNTELANTAGLKYTGTVQLTIKGTTIEACKEVISPSPGCSPLASSSVPANGVIYVANGTGCTQKYDPFKITYKPSTENIGCGNVYVKGEYTGQLTIGAARDIIINGELDHPSSNENALLGLIANNFVRIYHPCSNETEVRLVDLKVQAAILAINHSFIVDHYNCGNPLGSLNITGAIAQKFRGPVGLFNGSTTTRGYSKNYEYDDRLRYVEPPSFLDPVAKSWIIGRETIG
ncbi:MAG TPA: type II secretion system protein [Solirubrobacterales bacterium]|jgi:type II secretory pathway pseudopilin PulG|nr:type II secretion system protein [Solirubrobacterales bacterium]